jgi:hypothetical protein
MLHSELASAVLTAVAKNLVEHLSQSIYSEYSFCKDQFIFEYSLLLQTQCEVLVDLKMLGPTYIQNRVKVCTVFTAVALYVAVFNQEDRSVIYGAIVYLAPPEGGCHPSVCCRRQARKARLPFCTPLA